MKFSTFVKHLDGCYEAVRYIEQNKYGIEGFWKNCPRIDWMEYLIWLLHSYGGGLCGEYMEFPCAEYANELLSDDTLEDDCADKLREEYPTFGVTVNELVRAIKKNGKWQECERAYINWDRKRSVCLPTR